MADYGMDWKDPDLTPESHDEPKDKDMNIFSKTGKGVSTVMVDGKISYKTVLAFLFPLIAGLAGVGVHWVLTGQWDATETRLVLADFGASAVAALGAYVGAPGLTKMVFK